MLLKKGFGSSHLTFLERTVLYKENMKTHLSSKSILYEDTLLYPEKRQKKIYNTSIRRLQKNYRETQYASHTTGNLFVMGDNVYIYI